MPLPSSISLAGLTIKLHVVRGKDLVAKDKNWRGKKTGSDPFIRIYVDDTKVGYTKTIHKTCDPEWDEQLEFKFSADQVMKIVRNNKPLTLKIFDKDKLSFSDPMGSVEIPLDTRNTEAVWYPVGKGTGKHKCDNATGEILVSAEIKALKYLEMEPGMSHKLEIPRVRFGIAWDVVKSGGWGGTAKDLDVACVAVQRNGVVDLKDCVYYGNLYNSNSSISHSGDCMTGRKYGDNEQIGISFDEIPHHIVALYFVLSAAHPDHTLADVAGTEIRMVDSANGIGICRYSQSDFGHNGSTYMIRVHRARDDGRWYLQPMGAVDETAHEFGTIIPQIKAYSRDVLDNPEFDGLDPDGRQAIMRKGGASIRIRDYVKRFPSNLTFALSWDFNMQPPPTAVNDEHIEEVEDPHGERAVGGDGDEGVERQLEEKPLDLDASVICLDHRYQLIEVVSKSHLESVCGAIRHGGDEDGGGPFGDSEQMRIYLAELDPRIKHLVFVINSFNGHPLDAIKSASCRIIASGHDAKEIASYKLEDAGELAGNTAFLMASLFNPSHDEEGWCLRVMPYGAQGTTAEETVDQAQQFLENNHFWPPPELPELDEEMLREFVMPEPKPMEEDPEIVFLGEAM